MGQQNMLAERLPTGQIHQPEPARIGVADRGGVAEHEDDMLVVHLRAGAARRAAGHPLVDHHAPGHPEMGEHDRPVVELDDQVFRAPPDADDGATGQALLEILGQRPAQVAAGDPDAVDPAPFHHARESAADSLDFGQFGHGGNLARARVPRYGPAMVEEPRTTRFGFDTLDAEQHAGRVRAVFEGVAGGYDLMNDLMSGGLHRLWKASLVDWLAPRPGWTVIDVAGGTGDIARFIRRRVPARVIVCDASPAMLDAGRDRTVDDGILDGLSLVCGRAEALPFPRASADAVTIAFGLRNLTDRAAALAEFRRVLRPGGRLACLEFSHPRLPGLAALYDAYSFQVLPRLGDLVTGRGDAYRYLVESIRTFPDQDSLADSLAAAGLGAVRYRNLSGGIVALHTAWRT